MPASKPKIVRLCRECKSEFQIDESRAKSNRGYFCSMECKRRYEPNLMDRLLNKIDKTDSCWLWKGPFSVDGYGVISVGRRGSAKNIPAHRLSYFLHFGEIPAGMNVCHTCDVRKCVNPAHLFLGTQADNMRDMVLKGRSLKGDLCPSRQHPENMSRGQDNYNSVLTEEAVRDIRASFKPRQMTRAMLAKKYGVKEATIKDVILRKSWKHIE